MRRKRQHEDAFELLRSVLGARVIMVYERVTGRILWQETPKRSCGYQSEGIDSESQRDADGNQQA